MASSEHDEGNALREGLGAIDGIERVLLDEGERDVIMILRADVDPDAIEARARALIGDSGYTASAVFRPDQRDRQRVRFAEMRRTDKPDNQVHFRIVLEWGGTDYAGEATGGQGDAVELRTAANAAIAAVTELASGDLDVRLAGVKQMRAFDADMVVISLYRPDHVPHSLVGAVVAGDDPRRAAAAAVLNALNRLLGNYLST